MPENFPVRSVQAKINSARRRFGGERQTGAVAPCVIGDMAGFFRQLAAAVADMAEAERPSLDALEPAVNSFLESLQKAGIEVRLGTPFEGTWPAGSQTEVLRHLEELAEQVSAAREQAPDPETEARLYSAEDALESLHGEAIRPKPEWPVMSTESLELRRCLQPGSDPAAARIAESAVGLFRRLGDVAEKVIAALPDLERFRDQSDAAELVVIPSGDFMMGSPEGEVNRDEDEGSQHDVMIAGRFALGRYPVTFVEYDVFTDVTGRERVTDEGWGRGRRPVINVSWEDAVAYADWLSERTGKPYRLPSESEWEYACRAGTVTRYSWGDEITPKEANYDDSDVGQTTEVGRYRANPWGLYDMHGNVWEWCADAWHDDYEGAPKDGSVWSGGEEDQRVLRGGSWNRNPRNLRSAYRGRNFTDGRSSDFGFRVARTLSR